MRWPGHVKDRVIEMHEAGEPIKAIIAETGVPQATQYEWLRALGMLPTRQPRGRARLLDTDQLLNRVEKNTRRILELERLVRRLQARLSEYEDEDGVPLC